MTVRRDTMYDNVERTNSMEQELRVLIVEDVASDAEITEAELRHAGIAFVSRRVETEDAFIRSLTEFKPDIILADYALPHFDGLAAVTIARRIAPKTPVIIVTGSVDEEKSVQCMKLGAADLLLKGHLTRLASAVESALEHKRVREEKERADESLRESENRFRALIEHSSDAIALATADGTVLYDSPSITHILGYGPKDRIGRKVFEYVHPDDRPLFKERYVQFARQPGATLKVEARFRHTDGSWRWIEAVRTNLLAEPSVAAIVVNYRDITERKEAEQAILREKAFSESMVNSLPGLLYLFDETGRLVRWNRNFEKVTGYSSAELAGLTPLDFFIGEEKNLIFKQIQNVFTQGAAEAEANLVSKNGKQTPYYFSGMRIVVDGRPHLIGMGLDISKRKKAEEALQNAEVRYRTLFEQSPAGILVIDPETTAHVEFNEMAYRQLGYTREEFSRLRISDYEALEKPEDTKRRMEKILLEGRIDFETKHRTKDGRIRDVEATVLAFPFYGRTLFYAMYRDITERKRTQDEIKFLQTMTFAAHEALDFKSAIEVALRNICESTGWTYGEAWIPRADGTCLEQSPVWFSRPEQHDVCKSMRRFSTFTPGVGLPGKAWVSKHAEWLEDVSVNGAMFLRSDEAREIGFRSGLALPIVDNNEVLAVLVFLMLESRQEDKRFIDIVLAVATQLGSVIRRKQAEESVRKLMSAMEQTDEIIIMTDIDATITYVNPAFRKVYGYSEAEVLGRNPRMLKSGLWSAEQYALLWRQILAGETFRAEMVNKSKDGRLIPIESSVSPVMNPDGTLAGYIAVQEDISERRKSEEERKELERQLYQIQKMESIGTLAGGIAHDFNNILGIILGHASILQQVLSDPQKLSQSINAITSAVQRGAGLVRQILTFARKTEISFAAVSVNEAIRDLIKMLGQTFPKTISLSLQLDHDLPLIIADQTQIHQSLLNLCVNARDAMPHGGTLTFKTGTLRDKDLQDRFPDAPERSYVFVSVSDTGVGMDETTRDRAFEPFFTTKEKGKGTGLGLAVVFGVVTGHNGFIDLKSEIGAGSTFTLYFPSSEGETDFGDRSELKRRDIRGGTETILVVEDEVLLQDLVKSMLEVKGYHVLTASDGEEAVRVYRDQRNSIAAVLSDMGLPKLAGWEAYLKMKEINPAVKVIFASGYLEPNVRSEIFKAGVKDFIQKPYDTNDILLKIRNVIDKT